MNDSYAGAVVNELRSIKSEMQNQNRLLQQLANELQRLVSATRR